MLYLSPPVSPLLFSLSRFLFCNHRYSCGPGFLGASRMKVSFYPVSPVTGYRIIFTIIIIKIVVRSRDIDTIRDHGYPSGRGTFGITRNLKVCFYVVSPVTGICIIRARDIHVTVCCYGYPLGKGKNGAAWMKVCLYVVSPVTTFKRIIITVNIILGRNSSFQDKRVEGRSGNINVPEYINGRNMLLSKL